MACSVSPTSLPGTQCHHSRKTHWTLLSNQVGPELPLCRRSCSSSLFGRPLWSCLLSVFRRLVLLSHLLSHSLTSLSAVSHSNDRVLSHEYLGIAAWSRHGRGMWWTTHWCDATSCWLAWRTGSLHHTGRVEVTRVSCGLHSAWWKAEVAFLVCRSFCHPKQSPWALHDQLWLSTHLRSVLRQGSVD